MRWMGASCAGGMLAALEGYGVGLAGQWDCERGCLCGGGLMTQASVSALGCARVAVGLGRPREVSCVRCQLTWSHAVALARLLKLVSLQVRGHVHGGTFNFMRAQSTDVGRCRAVVPGRVRCCGAWRTPTSTSPGRVLQPHIYRAAPARAKHLSLHGQNCPAERLPNQQNRSGMHAPCMT